jgi:uncharacterized RDD family membrane protein YckC
MSHPTPDGIPPYQPRPASPQPQSAQPYPPQPYSAQPYPPQPYSAQSYPPQPYSVQPYSPQPYSVQPYPPQAYEPQPYPPQPYKADPYQPLPVPYAAYSPVPGSRPVAFDLVSRGGRLGAALLDNLLVIVTLGIGWLIWSLIVYDRGQTPARQLLGHVAVDSTTGEPLSWGRTALRELVLKGIVGYLATSFTCYVYFFVDSLMIFNDRRQTLHDMMASSLIVYRHPG